MTDTPHETERNEPARAPSAWRTAFRWGLGVALFTGLAAGTHFVSETLTDPTVLPLKRVRIAGELTHLDRLELERAVSDSARGGFFTVDVQQVWRAARQLPWVEEVSVRRVWPSELRIKVKERVAVARWGDDGLLTARGEVFRPGAANLPKDLPQLAGVDSRAPEVLKAHGDLSRRLAPLGLSLAQLRQDARGAWWLTFTDGLAVAVGAEGVEARIDRFLRLYPQLAGRGDGRLVEVDLRYPHGIAVRRAAPVAEPAPETVRPLKPKAGTGKGRV
jgi:cell division protein FtsQ